RRNHRMKKEYLNKPNNLTFVVPCQWLQDYLKRSHLGHYPSRVIYNGVDLEKFKPVESDLRQKYHLGERKIVLSVAADWDERKGISYLMEAAKQLGEDYCFVLVGLSQEQIQALPEGMLGISQTNDVDELIAWYSLADCFANPTMEDNMPMVNLEALACGTPIAVFATGGCPEAVTSDCGIVVPKGDQNGLNDAIRTLCAQSAVMQADCIARSKQFDCNDTFRAYLSLYKELCQ
ncbi:MAG: glycosyltransferase, partial [Clostridia bacterium]|nr:glycosyltransferase [Clostridia bacterium]